MENQFAIKKTIIKIFFFLFFVQNIWGQQNNYLNKNVEVNDKNIEILIYPNPTREVLNIETDCVIDYVLLINQRGEIVLKVQPQNNQIDLSHLNSGFYLLHVYVNGEKIKKAIIKKKE